MIIKKILRYFRKKRSFKNSSIYWKNRYTKGGNSGSGSYGHLAEFKSTVINDFVLENAINSVIEFGCGDGNQLIYSMYPKYIGFDISDEAINKCKASFDHDESKKFVHISKYNNEKAELTLSLDVIFHLIEDNVYKEYMRKLFESSNKYVIIYSSNTNDNFLGQAFHVKHRIFTELINSKFINFKLIKQVKNKYPFDGTEETSFSDFYIYEKK